MKYEAVLQSLDDDTLYQASTIARLGNERKLFPHPRRSGVVAYRRCRACMAKRSQKFPPRGDGLLHISRQPARPAWFGWRWKEAAAQAYERGNTSKRTTTRPRQPPVASQPRERKRIPQFGRPLIFADAIALLKADELYIPANIVDIGTRIGIDTERARARSSLSNFARNNNFPPEGDGIIRYPNQGLMPGWFGWRWLEAAGF